MNAAAWYTSEIDPEDASAPGRPMPALVSLHFLRAALRRRRGAWLLSTLAGLLLSTAFLVLVPATAQATATLVMAHDPQADPEHAMATDVSLASTRAVAQQVITQLHLPLTPTELLKTVTATPTTSDILTLTLTAPTRTQAVARLQAFSTAYLTFRTHQLSLESNELVAGMNRQIAALQAQVDDVTRQINALTVAGQADTSQLSDFVTQRAQIVAQISTLQQSAQDATLRTTAISSGSRIIDRADTVPQTGLRRIALALASGLIGGTALGGGLILFLAITSDRLGRRVEVASALQVPVTIGVGRLTPLPHLRARLPFLRKIQARRADDRHRLASWIEAAIPAPGRGRWLAVGCVDNADEVRYGLVAAALALQQRGRTIRLIDLTNAGGLTEAVEELLPARHGIRITVSRPRVVPSLAKDLADVDTFGPETQEIPVWGANDVFLVLTDLDPSVGLEHLSSWTQTVVIAVTAGTSSVERLRTAGDLVRAAGLELAGAALIRIEPTDESSGFLSFVDGPGDER